MTAPIQAVAAAAAAAAAVIGAQAGRRVTIGSVGASAPGVIGGSTSTSALVRSTVAESTGREGDRARHRYGRSLSLDGMNSPAERYEAARRRAADTARFRALAEFATALDFELDQFQHDSCEALERGSGVLVCAPTGAGKTVVGEFAVHLALRQGRKCFYTTPIKALSNQKYHDLVQRHGAERVGLLTGDNSINGDAPVVVMTTEVLRNMLYAGSTALDGLSYVVMDEVHYLADRFRGAVWEEVIIHLPESVTLVSLSATVSNAEEFADWLVTVRGHTEVVVTEHRPVPLWQHMLVGRRMFDLFHDVEAAQKHDVHPELLRYTREMARRLDWDGGGRGRPTRTRRWLVPSRPEVVERLDREGLLPAILFIFSRAGCD